MPRPAYPPLDPAVRARLRAARAQRGLSVRDIARMVGISPTTYHRIEAGVRGGSPTTLARLADVLDLEPLGAPPSDPSDPSDPSATPAPCPAGADHPPIIGAMLAAARRARGWSQRRAVAELARHGAVISVRTLANLERSGADWLATARALATALDLPPEALGLSDPRSVALPPEALTDAIWELFYQGDLRVARPLTTILTAALAGAPPSVGGVWALQALAVATRDQGDAAAALRLLDLAAARARALDAAPPDLHAALAMRRARALADRSPDGPAADAAWQATQAARAASPRCTARLTHVIALQTAVAAAARGRPVAAWRPLLERAMDAAIRDGGRDPSGVLLAPVGVIHARLDAARAAVAAAADSSAPAALAQIAQDTARAAAALDAPRRWRLNVQIALADAWRLLHAPDDALAAAADAAALLPTVGSPKLTRRLIAIVRALPASIDRRTLLDALTPHRREGRHA